MPARDRLIATFQARNRKRKPPPPPSMFVPGVEQARRARIKQQIWKDMDSSQQDEGISRPVGSTSRGPYGGRRDDRARRRARRPTRPYSGPHGPRLN